MRDSATRSSVEGRASSQLHHKPQVTKDNSVIRGMIFCNALSVAVAQLFFRFDTAISLAPPE